MVFDDTEPRASRDAALRALTREDLDLQGTEELQARIETLRAEIARAEAALSSKQARKSAADALFSFKGGAD